MEKEIPLAERCQACNGSGHKATAQTKTPGRPTRSPMPCPVCAGSGRKNKSA
jgi:DnaJ-class molecular chaperone